MPVYGISTFLLGKRRNAPDASNGDQTDHGNRNNQSNFAQDRGRYIKMVSYRKLMTYVSGVIDCKCVHETDIARARSIPGGPAPSDGQVPSWLT